MPTAPVTAKAAALQQAAAAPLQGAMWSPEGQPFQPSADRVNPPPSMGAGNLSNAAWAAQMFPTAPQPLPHQQMQQPQPHMQMQQPQMQQPPAPSRPARPEYQGQTYGGGGGFSKGNYGAARTTEPVRYNRLPGNEAAFSNATNNATNNATDNVSDADWIQDMNADDTTSEGWWVDLSGVPGGGRNWVANPNYADPNAVPEVPEGYGSADEQAQDADGDGTVTDAERLAWRPEDGRYGVGHGGQNLSQQGLNHIAKFGVVPTEGRISLTPEQFSQWAQDNDAHGSEQFGRRAAWDGGWDSSRDGIIDASELAKYQADLKQKAIAARMKSHNVTEKSAAAHMEYMLAQGADVNQDGTVTAAEWRDPKSVALREAAKK